MEEFFERLVLSLIKEKKYLSFTNKELNIIFNDINDNHKISDKDFLNIIESLVDKNKLLINISNSGIKYYQTNE